MRDYDQSKRKKKQKTKREMNYSYMANGKLLNWHDRYAKLVFEHKPYYMKEKERKDEHNANN